MQYYLCGQAVNVAKTRQWIKMTLSEIYTAPCNLLAFLFLSLYEALVISFHEFVSVCRRFLRRADFWNKWTIKCLTCHFTGCIVTLLLLLLLLLCCYYYYYYYYHFYYCYYYYCTYKALTYFLFSPVITQVSHSIPQYTPVSTLSYYFMFPLQLILNSYF
jgi:hypothetical protein